MTTDFINIELFANKFNIWNVSAMSLTYTTIKCRFKIKFNIQPEISALTATF